MENSTSRKKCHQNPATALKDNLIELLRCRGVQNIPDDIPRKYEKHGDLVLLPSNSFQDAIWQELGSSLWDVVAASLKCQRVARRHKIKNDEFRTPRTELLRGSDGWVTRADNGIRMTFDVTKCMFSSGNISEKLRISKFDCQGETVVDMYAGIGYFTLPFLVHAKASVVHACEWNAYAVEALVKNLKLNSVESKCVIHQGDNRKVCPSDVADRVNLGLIPSSQDGWETACRALKKIAGGMLHVHGTVTSGLWTVSPDCAEKRHVDLESLKKIYKTEWVEWASNTQDFLRDILQSSHESEWTVRVKHIEKVKSYAPHIDHLVLDVECRPSCHSVKE